MRPEYLPNKESYKKACDMLLDKGTGLYYIKPEFLPSKEDYKELVDKAFAEDKGVISYIKPEFLPDKESYYKISVDAVGRQSGLIESIDPQFFPNKKGYENLLFEKLKIQDYPEHLFHNIPTNYINGDIIIRLKNEYPKVYEYAFRSEKEGPIYTANLLVENLENQKIIQHRLDKIEGKPGPEVAETTASVEPTVESKDKDLKIN